ncbi:hypothetical protein [Chloracidobacterium aggregatum]|jgi:hypothetical protein|uniref:hypothetical protein n=1 Tax=Chloracidobacterium aggregatum TaxID=2851959 RepID=UPI001B8CD3C5|nr:hypothetical protein [Chloracidobacterium aggregatum]QUV87031.1 hypothetical protein J8C07_07440 [Chloracidobacterium sp. S]QUV96307.1 hypothetical protein J8C00_08260 [Chloracidobacterium sp. E]
MKHVAVATPDILAFDALGQSHRTGTALSRWETASVVSAAFLDVTVGLMGWWMPAPAT